MGMKTFVVTVFLSTSAAASAKTQVPTFKNVVSTYNRANRADTLQIHDGTFIPLTGAALSDFKTAKNSGDAVKVVQLSGKNDIRKGTFVLVESMDNITNYSVYDRKTQKAIAYGTEDDVSPKIHWTKP